MSNDIALAVEGAARAIRARGSAPNAIYVSHRMAVQLVVLGRLEAYIEARGYTWWQLFWHRRHGERRRGKTPRQIAYTAFWELWRHYRPSWLPHLGHQYEPGGAMSDYPQHTHAWWITQETRRYWASLELDWYDADLVRRWNKDGRVTAIVWDSDHVSEIWHLRIDRLGMHWHGYWRRPPHPAVAAVARLVPHGIRRLERKRRSA